MKITPVVSATITYVVGLILVMIVSIGCIIAGVSMLGDEKAAPAPRTPAGHLMMVLTDGKDFYVADGAGITVFDPNVVHRLIVAEPNQALVEPNVVEPNTP